MGHLISKLKYRWFPSYFLSNLYSSLISFSSITFPGAPYRIFLLFLPWLPCLFTLLSLNNNSMRLNSRHMTASPSPSSLGHAKVITIQICFGLDTQFSLIQTEIGLDRQDSETFLCASLTYHVSRSIGIGELYS